VVKIDVEGAETLVLDGMAELVRRHRPTVVMEWSPWQASAAGASVEGLAERLAHLDMQPNLLAPDGTTVATSYQELVELPFQNIVFKPGEGRS